MLKIFIIKINNFIVYLHFIFLGPKGLANIVLNRKNDFAAGKIGAKVAVP